MQNIFDLPVHPSADIFPMIPKDELQELADDITTNGLIHPIVIKDGVLIDGRNRLAACKIISYEPEVIELDGDIDAYIISSNINRRHMTKGQKAMAVAMIYPDAEHGGARDKGVSSLKNKLEFNKGYISQARTILKYAIDLSENVLSGSKPLSEAYKKALERKMAAEKGDEAMNELRISCPDLADLVDEEKMTLEEAIGAKNVRESNERANRTASVNAIKSFIDGGINLLSGNKSRIKLLINNRKDVEALFGFTVNEAINNIEKIQKSDELLKLLRGIK